MRFKLIPKEQSFFDLFEIMARKVQEGAVELLDLMRNFANTDLEQKAGRIIDIEHEADDLTHNLIRRMNTTFITPFDREDIHRLSTNLDDVLDHIEAAAEYLQLHKIEKPLDQMVALTDTLSTAATVTAEAMPGLRKMKELQQYWVEIHRLENEGDRMYRRTIAELFSGNYDAFEVLRLKDIIEEIEAGIDSLEDVANTIEGIFLKHT